MTIYLGVCRQEIYKPKLNDKSTLLSEVCLIGPSNITLLKPVVLLMDHCAKNVNQDWAVTLYSNTFDNSSGWQVCYFICIK